MLFVVEGELTVTLAGKTHVHAARRLCLHSAGERMDACATKAAQPVRFHWIRKAYEFVDGIDVPEAFFAQRSRTSSRSPMPGTEGRWATTRFVDPHDMRHDMHVTIVTFEPGGVIPFAETHVMEHGLYVLEGKAVYRLNQDWVEVEAGDYMWLRAFCPQACYAGGPGKFRYLLYKDVNRHMKLGARRRRRSVRARRRHDPDHHGAAADPRKLRRIRRRDRDGGDNHYPINGGKAERYHDAGDRRSAGPECARADLDRQGHALRFPAEADHGRAPSVRQPGLHSAVAAAVPGRRLP